MTEMKTEAGLRTLWDGIGPGRQAAERLRARVTAAAAGEATEELLEGLRGRESEEETPAVGWAGLMLQGIATSIDALSVGFTIAEYSWQAALTEALIIGIVTFLICLAGLRIGKCFGMRLAGKASILGGVILIAIGLEIFLTGVF